MTKRIVGCGVVVLALTWGLVASAAPIALPEAAQHGSTGPGAGSRVPGYLGIDVRDVPEVEATLLKLKDSRGAEIIRVDHDGPAGKMGLREHDVVLQMNGATIEGEDQIRRLLREIAPGKTVALTISRDGQKMMLSAQMADRTVVERQAWEQHLTIPVGGGPQAPLTGLPSEDTAASGGQSVSSGPVPTSKYSKGFLGTILLSPAYTGVMLERIGPQLSLFFGVPRGTGLLVKGVDPNSPAAVAGVRAGDVLLRADSKAVGSLTEWTRIVRDAKGRPVTVVVLRDRKETIMTVTPDAKKHS